MSKALGWVVAVAVLVAALLSLHQSSVRAGRDAERVRIAEEQAELALYGYRQERERLETERRKTLQAEQALYRERQKSQRSLQMADSAVAEAHQVLQDTASTVFQLRGALVVQVATTERLAEQFREYLAADSMTHYSWSVERAAAQRALSASDTVIAAKDRIIAAFKAKECKVLWFPCPSRTQVLVGSALVTAGVLTLARD
jgi:hypothetical protein